MNYIDLHTHTHYSDGTDEVIEYLKKAKEKKLSIISITDHNTCKAYEELKTMNVGNYYSGKIIPGIELNTKILGIPIEVLGYGIDTEKMNSLLTKYYLTSKERDILEVKRLYQKCKEERIELPIDFVEKYQSGMYASKYLHSTLRQNKENKKLIDEDAWENSNIFYRKYMSNPETKFYINMDDILPDFETVTNLVKECGGLLFLPHIFEYRDNSLKILNYILENYKIDGIECYYTTFTEEQHQYLVNLCKEKGFLISGGSDYHGSFKPDVDLGIGKGNLKIPESIVNNWIELVKAFDNNKKM